MIPSTREAIQQYIDSSRTACAGISDERLMIMLAKGAVAAHFADNDMDKMVGLMTSHAIADVLLWRDDQAKLKEMVGVSE